MKIITTLLFTLFLIQFGLGQNEENNINELRIVNELDGKWFIHKSNFPMWLKGDKTSPTFNYTLKENKKGIFLVDKVSFIKNGKQKYIKGIDKPTNSNNSEFIWRGNGILRIIKSKWKVLHLDFKNHWAIIYFEKILFTPEGYDVISKNSLLNPEIEKEINLKLNDLGVTEKLMVIEQDTE